MGNLTIRTSDLSGFGVPAYLAARPGSDDRLLVLDRSLSLAAADDLIAEMLSDVDLSAAKWVCGCYELPAAMSA